MFFQLCLQTQMCFSGTRGPYSVPHQCLHFLHFPFMTVIWQLAVWRTGSKGTAGEKSFETLSGLRTRGSTQEEESTVISNKEKLQMQFAGVMLSDLTSSSLSHWIRYLPAFFLCSRISTTKGHFLFFIFIYSFGRH